jgi:hypothetical protein
MAATSTCVVPVKGTHFRIVALDACGIPVTGASGLVAVTNSFVSVESAEEYEDGEEFFERNAAGAPCVNQKDDPTMKRVVLTVQLCEINVSAVAYILSARELVTGTPTTGTGFALAEGNPTNRFSLEVWQEVAGAAACDASGQQQYVYHAWPNVGAVQKQGYTVELGRSALEFTAETRGASASWDTLVGADWLPAGEIVDTDEHWVFNVTTTAPPTVACDPTTLAA